MAIRNGSDMVHKSQCSSRCFPSCVLGAFQSTSLSYLDPLGLETFDEISSRPLRSSPQVLVRINPAPVSTTGPYGTVIQHC